MLVEFLIGVLPWSKLKDKESVGRIKVCLVSLKYLR